MRNGETDFWRMLKIDDRRLRNTDAIPLVRLRTATGRSAHRHRSTCGRVPKGEAWSYGQSGVTVESRWRCGSRGKSIKSAAGSQMCALRFGLALGILGFLSGIRIFRYCRWSTYEHILRHVIDFDTRSETRQQGVGTETKINIEGSGQAARGGGCRPWISKSKF